MINLKIYEENNNLSFKENYSPIVCGNSNYEITFEFGSDWQSINNKTAIIIVGGKKTAKDFSGNVLTLPALPNCNSFHLIIFSSEGETTRLVSSPIEIEATPTSYAENLPEFEPLTTYVSELLTKINKMIDGTTKVKNAESADSATIAKNVSNPNLLLNGDFKINQRGKTSYAVNSYTVDRWFSSTSNLIVNVLNSGISVVGGSRTRFLQQQIEDYKSLLGKQVTISMKIKGFSGLNCRIAIFDGTTVISKDVPLTGEYQVVSFSETVPENLQKLSVLLYINTNNTPTTEATFIDWCKLEIGNNPTQFIPIPYAQELVLCQRYYQKIKISGNAVISESTSKASPCVPINTPLRTKGTLVSSALPFIKNASQSIQASSITLSEIYDNCVVLDAICSQANLTNNTLYITSNGEAFIDAEMY